MALAVLLGAFGAHALKTSLSPEMMQVYKTGVEYQLSCAWPVAHRFDRVPGEFEIH